MESPPDNAIGVLAILPAVTAGCAVLGVVVGWRRRRVWCGWSGITAGAVSLAATVATIASPPAYGEVAGVVGLAECAALLLLVVAATRWASPRQAIAAVSVAALAVAVCVLRFLPSDSLLDAVGACALWSAGPLAAVVIGGYPRLAELRRIRSVAAAQHAQRVTLSRELHDFVAHDVSGIVALAQAARFVADSDPGRALEALARIEAAGLQALNTMDRTVHMLRHLTGEPGATTTALTGLADLPALLARFDDTVRVEADLDPDLVAVVPPEVGATAYRLVTEALTNVRRHAPTATAVRASLRRAPGPALAVTITNDGPAGRRPPRPIPGGRSGLADLRDRIHVLGGSLSAGAHGDGWRVAALLPLESA
ncbi:sensor histidine kinase [Micromonospora cremea]|uniref:histidine kinase n=1 Tax=Micromonospora cremea TaxID=709881 RepID=A0A1N5YUC6_9ACTN|nr:histidine kinase [Micromonospora cremea]SIN13253.1 Signal transduction histidine kinase [Micromonospora cremea]